MSISDTSDATELGEVFRRVVDGMDLGILLTGAEQTIDYANAYAKKLFGINLIGASVASIRPLITSAGAKNALRGEVLILNEPQAREARCFLNVAPVTRDHLEQGLVWTFFELTDEIANTQAFIDFSTELAMTNRELRKKNEEILQLSRTDTLTGVANRRTILELLQKALDFASMRGQTLSVALMALDGLEEHNDRGLAVGDEALRQAAFAAGQTLGRDGTLGRFGGSTFLMVLPGADLDQAKALAEEIRHAIEKSSALAGQPLTVSMGCASPTGRGVDELLRSASLALSRGQTAGGNRVV